jgi:hypothetical protein
MQSPVTILLTPTDSVQTPVTTLHHGTMLWYALFYLYWSTGGTVGVSGELVTSSYRAQIVLCCPPLTDHTNTFHRLLVLYYELAHKVCNARHKRHYMEYEGKNKRPRRHICSLHHLCYDPNSSHISGCKPAAYTPR